MKLLSEAMNFGVKEKEWIQIIKSVLITQNRSVLFFKLRSVEKLKTSYSSLTFLQESIACCDSTP